MINIVFICIYICVCECESNIELIMIYNCISDRIFHKIVYVIHKLNQGLLPIFLLLVNGLLRLNVCAVRRIHRANRDRSSYRRISIIRWSRSLSLIFKSFRIDALFLFRYPPNS